MKKALLAAVTAVALLAGPAMAQRQEAPASDVKGAAPAPEAIQNAPAEKIAPPMSPTTPSTTGQTVPGDKPGEPRAGSAIRPGTDTNTGAERPGDTK